MSPSFGRLQITYLCRATFAFRWIFSVSTLLATIAAASEYHLHPLAMHRAEERAKPMTFANQQLVMLVFSDADLASLGIEEPEPFNYSYPPRQ